MKRKIIRLSPTTQVISLPKTWLKKHNLGKGSEVDVTDCDDHLKITSQTMPCSSESTISLKHLTPRLMWSTIDAAYVKGHSPITILPGSAEQAQFMTKLVRYFPGMIITHQQPDKVILSDVGIKDTDLEKNINRLFNLIITLITESSDCCQHKKWESLNRVKYKDYVINSHISYCLRLLNSFSADTLNRSITFTYLKLLEILADKLCILFTQISEKKSITTSELTLIKRLHPILMKFQRIHSQYSQQRIIEIDKLRTSIAEDAKTMNSSSCPSILSVCSTLFDLEELEIQFHL